jgi:hypothetical protein
MPRRSQIFRTHKGEGKWTLIFLSISLLINTTLVLIMSAFEFGGVVQPKKVVAIKQELIEETERTEPVTQRDEQVSLEKVVARHRGRAVADYGAVQGEVQVMEVDTPGLQGMDMDLGASLAASSRGLSEGWTMVSSAKGARKVKMGESRQMEEVLDDTAKAILNIIEKEKLLVVLLLDESGSLADDRQIMSAKLEYIFRDLQFAMTDQEAKNLRWAVVSYGKTTRELLGPSNRLAEVRRAIVNVRADITGEENIVAALNFVDNKLGGVAPRKMVVCLTDEQGSDLEPKAVEALVARMKKSHMYLYVLGRESNFSRTQEYEHDPVTGQGNWVDRGLSTAGVEVLAPHWYFTWSGEAPSGFGSYWLSLIAFHTNGRFFILSTERNPYKGETLDRYRPEWCSPSEYEKRNKETPLRAKVVEVLQQAYQGLPATHGYFLYKDEIENTLPWPEQQKFFKSQVDAADAKIKWVDTALRDLHALSAARMSSKEAKLRWAANYDLLIADLYKMRYVLIQMREVHERTMKMAHMPRPTGRNADPYIRFDLYHADRDRKTGQATGQPLGGKEAQDTKNRALQAYARVAAAHKGTPWEARAEQAKKYWPILTVGFNSTRYHSSYHYGPRL